MLQFSFEDRVTVPSSMNGNVEIQTADAQYSIIGQLWNMYICLQADDGLYLIDQHALAERIAFEKMKKKAHEE